MKASILWRSVLASVALILVLPGCTETTITGKDIIKQKSPAEQVAGLVTLATNYLLPGKDNNPQRAKDLMRRALEIDPKSAEAHHVLAMAFWQTMELDLAEEHFRKTLSYKPDFSQAHLNYAVYLLEQNRVDDALKQINVTLEDTLYDQRARAFMIQGVILQRLNEPVKAIESYQRAVALDRTNAPAMFGVALLSYQMGNYPQADKYFKQYRANNQDATPESALLGIRIAEKTGDANAKASYELTLKNLFPDSPEAHEYFGTAATGTGKVGRQ